MAITPDIQGLNDGVGLVPQGRLGSGIANVFDTNSVATNLARLGARMENLEKLKLATAAKLASAKQKEAVVKATKSNPFEAVAAAGKAAFRSGQKVNSKIVQEGLNEYTTKKSSGDIEGANQVVPLTKYKGENVNNKTASIESDIDNFWKNAGKFYLPNTVLESNIEASRPDTYEEYLNHDESTIRNKAYKEQPSTFNFDAVGQWAKDESGRTTIQKTLPNGMMGSVSGLSALYKLPMKKNGDIDENADLEVDYDVAKNFYATNPYIREQMQKFGDDEKERTIASDEYKNAATDKERQEILAKAIDKGENSYIYATLSGRADKDIRKNLEATYHRALAQKKAEGDVEKDYQFANVPYNISGRFNAKLIADPTKSRGIGFDYSYGNVPSYNFSKNPQELSSGTYFTPMGDPQVLEKLGLISKRGGGNGISYNLSSGVKIGSAQYINGHINQTKNRQIVGGYEMPPGILLPTGYAPLADDREVDGFVVNIITGPKSNLTQKDIDYLESVGYKYTDIQKGLEIPIFVERKNAAMLTNFIQNKFPNTLPKPPLTTSGR